MCKLKTERDSEGEKRSSCKKKKVMVVICGGVLATFPAT